MGVLDREYSRPKSQNFSAGRSPGGAGNTNGVSRGTPTTNFTAGGTAAREPGGNVSGVARNVTNLSTKSGPQQSVNFGSKSNISQGASIDRSLKGGYLGTPGDRNARASGMGITGSTITGDFKVGSGLINSDFKTSGATPKFNVPKAPVGGSSSSAMRTGRPATPATTNITAKQSTGPVSRNVRPARQTFTFEKTEQVETPFAKANPQFSKYLGGTQAKPVKTTIEEATALSGKVKAAGGYISGASPLAKLLLPKEALTKIGVNKPGYDTTSVSAAGATVDISYPGVIKSSKKVTATGMIPVPKPRVPAKQIPDSAAAARRGLAPAKLNRQSSGPVPRPVQKATTSSVTAGGQSRPTTMTPLNRQSTTSSMPSLKTQDRVAAGGATYQPSPFSKEQLAKLSGMSELGSTPGKKPQNRPDFANARLGGEDTTPAPAPTNTRSIGTAKASAPKSFKEAFSQARKQLGAGQVFSYKGKQYTTNVAGETGRSSGLSTKTSTARKTANNVRTTSGSSKAQKYITNFSARKQK